MKKWVTTKRMFIGLCMATSIYASYAVDWRLGLFAISFWSFCFAVSANEKTKTNPNSFLFCIFIVSMLSGCLPSSDGRPLILGGLLGTDIGAPDYGAREMPRQEPGESYRHFRHRLDEGGWTER